MSRNPNPVFPLALAGHIPQEVGALKELKVLYIYGNNLTGTSTQIPCKTGRVDEPRERVAGHIVQKLGLLIRGKQNSKSYSSASYQKAGFRLTKAPVAR